MADRDINTIPPASPVAGDDMLGVQGGRWVRFPFAAFDPQSVQQKLDDALPVIESKRAEVEQNTQIVVNDTATVVEKEAVVSAKHAEVLPKAEEVAANTPIALGAKDLAVAAMLTAIAQASLASTMALAAASAVSHDLSGVTAVALHRSPNPVVAFLAGDVRNDSDPSWPDKMADRSWMQRALNGAWIDSAYYGPTGVVDELQARCYKATVGAELIAAQADRDFSSNTGFWTLGMGWAIGGGVAAHSGGTPEYMIRPAFYPAQGIYKWEFDVVTADNANFLQVYDGNGSAYGVPIQQPGHYVLYVPTAGGTTARMRGVGACSFDNLSIKQVTGFTTASGAYYPSRADGKFYRLWKNCVGNSAWAFADPAAPSGAWSRPSPTLGTTTAAGLDASGATRLRFSGGVGDRPYMQNTGINVNAGESWTLSFYVDEAMVTCTMNLVASWAGTAAAPAAAAYRNGALVASTPTTNLAAGDFIEFVYTFTASGTFMPRLGPGSSAGMPAAFDVVMSRPQLERASRATSFELKTTFDQGQSETFDGNTQKFPKGYAIVAEAARVVIYDTVSPGRPMWMVFARSALNTGYWSFNNTNQVTSLAFQNGVLVIGRTNYGALVVNFGTERAYDLYTASSLIHAGIADRNSSNVARSTPGPSVLPNLSGTTVNAVAMCTMPDAPVDPVTGLQVPTIAFATSVGVAVLKHDGAIYYSAQNVGFESIDITPNMMLAGDTSSSAAYFVSQPGSISGTFGLNSIISGAGSPIFNAVQGVRCMGRGREAWRAVNYIGLSRKNEIDLTASLMAKIGDTYNTGWMVGDVRGAWLCGTAAGAAVGGELIANGDFADGTTTGWTVNAQGSLSVVAGKMRLTQTTAVAIAFYSMATVPGQTYRVIFDGTSLDGNVPLIARVGSTAGAGDLASVQSGAAFSAQELPFTATGATSYLSFTFNTNTAGVRWDLDNFTCRAVVADRSYKNNPLQIVGALPKTQVAAAAQLVAYGNFSAANYLRQAYSANLDFGTGAWRVPVSMSLPTLTTAMFPDVSAELIANGDFATDTVWTKESGWSIGGGKATHAVGAASGLVQPVVAAVGKFYRVLFTVSGATAGTAQAIYGGGIGVAVSNGTWEQIVKAVNTSGLRINVGANFDGSIDNVSVKEVGMAVAVDRSGAAGAYWRLGCWPDGTLGGEAYDGATARAVSTTASYAGVSNLSAALRYSTSGTLSLEVSGVPVAQTTGAPLASLNNAAAVLTVGNNFALTAAFPGSLCMLKPSATLPSDDACRWMYEQEKAMFQPGAQITLPDSGTLVGMGYDARLDAWLTSSAANHSLFTGLVRTESTPAAAGSISNIASSGGVKLVARTGANPGVDITIPPQNLREELLRQAEAARQLARPPISLDWVGGFTAATNSNTNVFYNITGLSIPSGATLDGATFSHPSFPAGTTLAGANTGGTNFYASANAGLNPGTQGVAFLDFILPLGMEAKAVYTNGSRKTVGATKDYTVLFDGFRERVRFLTPPGATAPVSVDAIRRIA